MSTATTATTVDCTTTNPETQYHVNQGVCDAHRVWPMALMASGHAPAIVELKRSLLSQQLSTPPPTGGHGHGVDDGEGEGEGEGSGPGMGTGVGAGVGVYRAGALGRSDWDGDGPARVLDFGCGPGKLVVLLREKYNMQTVGYDISSVMLATARKSDPEHPESYFGPSAVENPERQPLPFASNSFHGVISTWVTCAIQSKELLGNRLQELHRVLLPSGSVVIVDNNWRLPFFQASEHYYGDPSEPIISGAPVQTHLKFRGSDDVVVTDRRWLVQDYVELLKAAGFSNIRIIHPPMYDSDLDSELQYLSSQGLFSPPPNFPVDPVEKEGLVLIVARK